MASGNAPCEIELSRGAGYFRLAEYTVRVSAEGYPTKEVPLSAGLNGWYWGNLFLGGGLGMFVVDPLTGTMFSHPDTHIDMATAGSSNSLPATMPGNRWTRR
jgi:hypothetical protein